MKTANKRRSFQAAVMAVVMIVCMMLTAVRAYAEDEMEVTDSEEKNPVAVEETDRNTWVNQMTDVEVEPESPDNGVIVFEVATMPNDVLDRTVRANISHGPADETLKSVKLNGLNSFVGSAELEPGRYFCSYMLSNDTAMDYPVEARDDAYTIEVTAGSCTVVYLDVSGVSFFEQITGHPRNYDKEETIENDEGFDTNATGQIGCWLTVPETFGSTVLVYVQNLITGDVVTMKMYESNNYTAVATDVAQGRYKVVGTEVLEDGDDRFTVACEQDTLTTRDNEGFHLTISDAAHPDAKLVTPSRNNNSVVQEANTMNSNEETADSEEPADEATPVPSEAPVEEVKSNGPSIGTLMTVVVILVMLVVVGVVAVLWWKNQKQEE